MKKLTDAEIKKLKDKQQNRTAWTDDELAELKRLIGAGLTRKTIISAKVFDRTPLAISNKIQQLRNRDEI